MSELTLEEIPEGLLSELKEHFVDDLNMNFTIDLEGDIDSDTVSMKATYVKSVGDEEVEMPALRPETMETVTIKGYPHMTYIIRVNETDNGVVLKRVLEAGIVAIRYKLN